MQAELLLEPVDHPKTPRDLHLGVVVARHGGLVGRDERRGLQVARRGGVDGGRGAVREAGNLGREAPGAQHLAGFVCRACQHLQSGGDASVLRGLLAHFADDGARSHQLGQHVGCDGQGLPFPVVRRRPVAFFVVEGHVAHLRGNRIDQAPGEAVVEVAREQQIGAGARPDVGLVLGNPVGLGFFLEVAHGIAHANGAKGRFPPPGQARGVLGAPLVEPDHGGAQGLAVLVQRQGGAALRGDDEASDVALVDAGGLPQLLAGLAQGLPEYVGVRFHPAGFGRLVGDRYLRFVHQVAVQVEQQGAHALRAVVDGEQVGGGHGVSGVLLF